MTRAEIEQKLQQLLTEYLNLNSSEILPADSDLIHYGMDSMKAIHFSLMMEEQFNIEYSTEELGYQNFKTVNSMTDTIETKLFLLRSEGI